MFCIFYHIMYANDNFSFTFINVYEKCSRSLLLSYSFFDYILFYCPPEQSQNKGDISYLYYTDRKCIFKLFLHTWLTEHCAPKKAILWMMFLLKSHTKRINFYSYLMHIYDCRQICERHEYIFHYNKQT